MTEAKGSMMRVSSELLGELKVLKDYYKSSGKSVSNGELAQLLVREELKNSHVKTQDGYAGEGTVVMGPDNSPLVIMAIEKGKVTFSDNSCLVNGSKTCHELRWLADSVAEFSGGFYHEYE